MLRILWIGMARRQNYMILEPAYRRLHKLKEMATEENVSPKIRAEIDAIIDLLKVSGAIFFISSIWTVSSFMDENERDREKRESDMKRNHSIYLVMWASSNVDFIKIYGNDFWLKCLFWSLQTRDLKKKKWMSYHKKHIA